MSEEILLKYAYCDLEKVGPKFIIRCPDGTLHVTPSQVRLGEEGEQFIPREELPLVTSEILGISLSSPKRVYSFANQIYLYRKLQEEGKL
jgi:hypothetical protein